MKKLLCAILLLASALFFAVQARAQAPVLVIANPGVNAAAISKNDLRDVFTGAATSLKDGSHVDPILLKTGSIHQQFLASYLDKSDAAFHAGWRSLVFSGQGSMPRTLESEAAVVDFVAHNPGAIGYISQGTAHEGVKVLAIK